MYSLDQTKLRYRKERMLPSVPGYVRLGVESQICCWTSTRKRGKKYSPTQNTTSFHQFLCVTVVTHSCFCHSHTSQLCVAGTHIFRTSIQFSFSSVERYSSYQRSLQGVCNRDLTFCKQSLCCYSQDNTEVKTSLYYDKNQNSFNFGEMLRLQ